MFACLHASGNLQLLIECASHFSPLVEETSSDTVVFDVRGLDRLVGTPEQIADAIQRRVGIPAHLAIASNPETAVFAARGFAGTTVIPPGREAATLAGLPINLLGGPSEFAYLLNLWGVRTFGDFTALPALGVSGRLGEEGAHRQQMASGATNRQLRIRTDAIEFREERELEDSIDSLESLLFLISQMLNELIERLRFHALSVCEIRLCLKLERAADYTLNFQLPRPLRDAKVFLKLLQLEIEQKLPLAPIQQVHLELMPAKPRVTQHGLFLPSSPEPEKLEITLARIRNLVGAANVLTPELLDTHRADAFHAAALKIAKVSPVAHYESISAKLALRRFRPPQPARVWCTGSGQPVRILSPVAEGKIIACAGPWQCSGDWWTTAAWNGQQWDIEIQNVAISRLFHDLMNGQWFIEGHYD